MFNSHKTAKLPKDYASSSSTKYSYAQIEKKCLAIVFGRQMFEQYVIRRQNVLVETDHKPSKSKLKKTFKLFWKVITKNFKLIHKCMENLSLHLRTVHQNINSLV